MRHWQKLILSIVVGVAAGLLLPLQGGDTGTMLRVVVDALLAIGTYVLMPFIFVHMSLATADLFQDRDGRGYVFRTLGFLFATSFLLALIGGLVVVALPIERIPIIVEETSAKDVPDLATVIGSLIAPNAFQLVAGPIQAMPGLLLFSIIFGIGLNAQRHAARPVFDLLESLARVFQTLNRVVVEILLYGSAVFLCARIVAIRGTPDLELFIRVFAIIGGLTLLLILAAYPLLLRLHGIKKHPFAWMRHLSGALLIGISSGNSYLPLGSQVRESSDKLRHGRRIWAWYYPVASIVGRAGAAMVTAVCFFMVVKSYSSLEISISQFFIVILASLLLSFIPNGRILTGLALLSTWFGQGIEEGYLILLPITPLLISVAVAIDVVNQTFIAWLLAELDNRQGEGSTQRRTSRLADEFNML